MSEHPILAVSKLSENLRTQLAKLPAYLPTEEAPYKELLKPVRNKFEFAYVYHWLENFRSVLKMADSQFNIHIFEEELVGIVQPVKFLTKLKLNLMNNLLKVSYRTNDVELFDYNVNLLLGPELEELLERNHIQMSDFEQNDVEDEYLVDENGEEVARDANAEYKKLKFFEFCPISVKIDILYMLIERVNHYENFKRYTEKIDPPIDLRLDPIFWYFDKKQFPIVEHTYFLLDDNRLYHQKLIYDTKLDKNDLLKNYDPKLEWECLTNDFYEMVDIIKKYEKIPLLKKLSLTLVSYLEEFGEQEVRWKKNYNARLREKNLQQLMQRRKRSSRLQEKAERKKVESEKRRLEQEQMVRDGIAMRAAKRMKLKEEKEDKVKRERARKEAEEAMKTGDIVMVDEDEETKPAVLSTGNGNGQETAGLAENKMALEEPAVVSTENPQPETVPKVSNPVPVQATEGAQNGTAEVKEEVTGVSVTETKVPEVAEQKQESELAETKADAQALDTNTEKDSVKAVDASENTGVSAPVVTEKTEVAAPTVSEMAPIEAKNAPESSHVASVSTAETDLQQKVPNESAEHVVVNEPQNNATENE